MKKLFMPVFASIALGLFLFACRVNDEVMPHVALVHASELACRKKPALDSPVVRYYHFGTPLMVTERSAEKSRVGGIEAFWYREKVTGGWLFGGFLLHSGGTSPLAQFDSQRIRCNVICGGQSCFYDFSAIIVGDYYVAEVFLEDYPMAKGDPATGIVIGKCAVGKDRISFGNTLKIAGYDLSGAYLPDVERNRGFTTMDWVMNRFAQTYEKRNDAEGAYYLQSGAKAMPPRKVLREKCASKTGTEEIWWDVKVFREAPLADIQKKFPLVKAR